MHLTNKKVYYSTHFNVSQKSMLFLFLNVWYFNIVYMPFATFNEV